ncbi:hypothetical protein HGA34_03985 [Candidatus Falkowbacteria bacterium]|nr:hypothetical protein [Candidatus Falkowbacteria bacterium]
MNDLVMSKAMFFSTIVLPFFGGWLFAWLSSRFLVNVLLSHYRNYLAILCTMVCAVIGTYCFQWINFLIVNKLFLLDMIRLKDAQSFTVDALPSLLCFAFFMRRSYKKITQPCR